MKKFIKLDYDKPIKLLGYKKPWFDIIFYSAGLSLCALILFYLLFIHNGKFEISFPLWRVLVCIPLIMILLLFKQLLEELRVYPQQLMRKNIWKIDELMKMTNKNREETEKIMNRVIEACFVVDKKSIKKEIEE